MNADVPFYFNGSTTCKFYDHSSTPYRMVEVKFPFYKRLYYFHRLMKHAINNLDFDGYHRWSRQYYAARMIQEFFKMYRSRLWLYRRSAMLCSGDYLK
jgi:hypothetical protein